MPPRAQLFTVRLWVEDLGDDRKEWRGKVQHVLSGEAQYFRDWLALQAFMGRWLQGAAGQESPAE